MGHVHGADEESIISHGDLERDLSSLKTIIEVQRCPMCAQVRHMGGRAGEESAGACFGRRSAAAPGSSVVAWLWGAEGHAASCESTSFLNWKKKGIFCEFFLNGRHPLIALFKSCI